MTVRQDNGAELIGAGSATADVELIMLAWEVLKELGFNGVELRLSHAGLIKALLASLGLSAEEQDKVLEQILDETGVAIARLQSERPDVSKVLTTWLGCKGESPGFLRNLKALYAQDSPELRAPLDNFIQIVELLEAMACNYQIDIASGRGFEYYTGVIFQFFIGEEKVGGGGRYDALIPLMGGENTPASGFALYLDSLMNLVKLESAPKTQRILVKAEPEVVKEGFNIASRLRNAGYVAEVHLGGKPPANLRWRLDVQAKAPLFVLTDLVKKERFVAKTETKVLTILRGKDADKDSIA